MRCGPVMPLRCLESCRLKKVHVHDNTVKHGQCVCVCMCVCACTHTISIIMVFATLVMQKRREFRRRGR